MAAHQYIDTSSTPARARASLSITNKEWLMCLIPTPLWAAAVVTSLESIATVAALTGAILSFLWVRRFISSRVLLLSYMKLGAISLLAIMSLSWLVSAYFSYSVGKDITFTLEQIIGTSVSAYSGAVLYSLFFAASLAMIGRSSFIQQAERGAIRKLLEIQSVPTDRFRTFLIGLSALDAALILNGVVSYRAFNVAGYEEGRLAWFIPILEITASLQVGINSLVLYKILQTKSGEKKAATIAVAATSIALTMFMAFTRGRLEFIFCAISHLYWYCFFLGRLPKVSRIILILFLSIPILYTGSLLNNFIRSGSINVGDFKDVSILSLIGTAISEWQVDSTLQDLEKARSAENLGSRPLIANPLAKSMELPIEQQDFMYGINLRNSFIWAVPSAIFPNKAEYPVQENLLYVYFPIGTEDTADSPYLYAYTDFGYFGLIIYPLVLAFLWSMALIVTRMSSPWITLLIACMWFSYFTIYIGEASIVGWFTNLRNLVIILPLGIAAEKFFSLSRRIKFSRA
jgi:hypothetical protein